MKGSKAFIAAFLIICMLPALAMPLFGVKEASANEILAQKPTMYTKDGKLNMRILNQISDYVADRFAFRKEMIGIWSAINQAIMSSANNQVVVGRNGWLYYASTIPDYVGDHCDEEDLREIAVKLKALQDKAEEQGSQFLFVIAPNKNSLYPEHMQMWIPNHHDMSNAALLFPLLDEYEVNYVNLFDKNIPYYKTDTHWTSEGAAIAADILLAEMGKEASYSALPFSQDGIHTGDLYQMLYPAGSSGENMLLPTLEWTYECKSDPKGGDAIKIHTKNLNGNGSLFCWRDSFGISLYPYLAQSFANAEFSRKTEYEIPEGDYDYIILEIAERNIKNILN